MSNSLKVQKKSILTDAVTEFKKFYPDPDEQQLTALIKLQQQYVETKSLLKNTQEACKKISRQIGQLKRETRPVDELIQNMQEQNAKANSLSVLLNTISENIFSHFELCNNTNKPAEQWPALPPRRLHSKQPVVTEEISIALLNGDVDSWNQYVESNPAASIYHRAEWKSLIHKVFGHECYYFFAHDGQKKFLGVLPLVRLRSRLFGDFMVSMPFFNYGGAIANSLSIEQKLIQAANSYAQNLGVAHIEYRDDIEREGLPVRTKKVNMILSLPSSHKDLWKSFTSKLRSQIRRAQREETKVSFGGKEYLNDFYTVFARNMRDLGTPVYGKSFFSEILQSFDSHCKIIVIHMGDQPVASAFLIGYKNTLEIPWASTIKDVNHLSMNMLLYWEVLKFAVVNRYKYFDFGRSSKGSGTFRFKRQWGAKPKPLYWHYWLAENVELPSLNPDNPKYALAINIWKRIPLFITKRLGPLIVRNLP